MTTGLNGLSVFIPDDAEAELPLICALGEDVSGINAIAGFMDCKAAIVALPVDDWNAELTPWPAPPLRRGKPFAGNADKMLERLDRLMSELPTLLKSNMPVNRILARRPVRALGDYHARLLRWRSVCIRFTLV